MKKKGFKVKRTRRNLYKRRKSAGRKAFELILLLIIVAALIFVGYSVAPPLIKFFSGQSGATSDSSEPAWTPPVQTSSSSEQSGDADSTSSTDNTSANSSDASSQPPAQPNEQASGLSVTAPSSALDSEKALTAYLKTVTVSGYDTVVFMLKDTNGQLLYKSALASVKDNETIIKGKLTAAEIVKACKAAGITAAADINTLFDRNTPYLFENAGYIISDGNWSWLDAAADKGGKPWTTPYSSDVVKYYASIAEELTKAGFESVILSNTIFPKFQNYDYNLLSSEVRSADRSDKLAGVANAAAAKDKAAGGATYVRIDAADLLSINTSDYKKTAEIWLSKDKLTDCNYLISLDVTALGASIQLTEKDALKVDSDISKAISQVYAQVKKTVGDTKIAVGITGSSALSDEKITAAKAAFEKLGYTNIVIG